MTDKINPVHFGAWNAEQWHSDIKVRNTAQKQWKKRLRTADTENKFLEYPKFRGQSAKKEPEKTEKESVGSPQKPPPGLGTHKKDSKYAEVIILTFPVYYSERVQSKINQGKRYMGKAWRKLNANFQEFFPVESSRTLLIPPTSCDHPCEVLPSREAHYRLSALSLLWDGHIAPSWLALPDSPKGKQPFLHKSHGLYKQFRDNELLSSVRESFVSV